MADVVAHATVGYLDDEAVVERILRHIDDGTTDTAESTWREPVEHYQSERRLSQEVDSVLRRWPVPFCPSAAVPVLGSYVARDAAGIPLLVVRDTDGTVHGFRNACRHRGATVVSGAGCARSLVCPFHGWAYRLDGSLRRAPHDDVGFPGLVKATRGLVAVRTVEQAGLIHIDQCGGGARLDTLRDLPELLGRDQVLLESTEFVVDANWKVLIEGFLEGYHLRGTHPKTFLPFGYDNLTVIEHAGPHSRVTFPFRRIEKLRDRGLSRRVDGLVTVVEHIFPNVIIARLSHHTTIVVHEPLAPNRTRQVVYRLTNRGAKSASSDARRDADFVAVGAAEDIGVALAVQRGLASGANEFLEFGRFEGAIGHFHRQLADALGAGVAGIEGVQR
jgi:phenylpropionate dioxygenase-like ring-hydroxylating dioxygenase large terminal subunit